MNASLLFRWPSGTLKMLVLGLLAIAIPAHRCVAEEKAAASSGEAAPSVAKSVSGAIQSGNSDAGNANKPHPLTPLIELATQAKQRFENDITKYSCLLIKRETIDGALTPHYFLNLKIRERRMEGDQLIEPFSVYARFLKPSDAAGREVLYVENERDGEMLVRRGGPRLPNLTLSLNPNGLLAKNESNHSVTEMGIRRMVDELINQMKVELQNEHCTVRTFQDAKVAGRLCDHVEVHQLKRRPDLEYQIAKIYIDREWKLPVYFASYAWADEPGNDPVLQEEYIFTRVKLNPDLTDLDFDRNNPAYKFRPEKKKDKEENEKELRLLNKESDRRTQSG